MNTAEDKSIEFMTIFLVTAVNLWLCNGLEMIAAVA
jgi:hypothetical protein